MLLQPASSSLSTKRRIKLVVAYDGYDFCGWAPQSGRRTVHGTLTEAVRQISGDDCEITGASRTDSGANARGQVCHFDTTNPMPIDRWPRVLNELLPPDLAVIKSSRVPDDFHSRFWADKRWYRYRIKSGLRDPFRSRQAYEYGPELNLELMQKAAKSLVGEHNFLAFSQEIPEGRNTVRILYNVELSRVQDEIRIDIVGQAFLRGMMRRMSGALWEIGRGFRPVESIEELLAQRRKEDIKWPTVLPACGLTLMKVFYGRHPKDFRDNLIPTKEDDDE